MVWASAIPRSDQPGKYGLDVQIRHPGREVRETEEDGTARLTTRLANGIRKQWDGQRY